MKKVKQACFVPDIEACVTPLRTRVQRGIAQVTVPPGAFTLPNIRYKYFCPASFLLMLAAALVLVIAGDGVGVMEGEGENRMLPRRPKWPTRGLSPPRLDMHFRDHPGLP
jgi:hypothetical protein